ncbi:HNH endonuclease [Pseudomonas sp. G5001]|uniref:HNH endonuclease n=1 Tax=Pseudomonas sp. G5001 TaxID=2738824 RepID=UPI0015A01942|nr:HNH endonuclease [Pseudomonas sp. G5001]NWB74772.1 HNH endonuclease [Pseudomonas sp. G5001]
MPAINNSVVFSDLNKRKIKEIKKEPAYSHTRWGDDDLEEIRREVRDFYRKEQRLNCAYCLNPVTARSAQGAHVEHIVSKSNYPQFMFEPKNLCVACPDCNEYKSQREAFADAAMKKNPRRKYPTNIDQYRIYHPHFDDYENNIKKAGHFYLEVSPAGGYTIYVCNLNRFSQQFGISEELLNNLRVMAEAERFHQR